MTDGHTGSEAPRPAALPAPGSPAGRRLGTFLALFGLSGLLLVGTALAVVAGPVEADVGPFGLEAHRRRIVALLDASDAAIASAEVAARDADRSLASTSGAASSAAAMMTQLSSSMRRLGASLRISVLGSQPFAPVADDMERVADRAATVAADLDIAASSVRLAAEDLDLLADDLAAMRSDLDAIRTSMAAAIDADAWRLLFAAILVWLMLPAGVSLWLGLRWLRPAGLRRGPGRPRPAGAARPGRPLPRRDG